MSSKEMIYSSVSFIESCLSEEFSIGDLAGKVFLSKTHYQRLFQAVMGEPVMEYVKKRRLQQAGIHLCESRESVLTIALRYGYSSHEGFTRAFKNYFGMSPSMYRKRYANTGRELYHEEVKHMITKEAKQNISEYAKDISKDLEALVKGIESWTEPANKEIERLGPYAGGMKVSFAEWSSLVQRIKTANKQMVEFLAQNTDVYELHDRSGQFMEMIDNITFQMNLLRFLTGVEVMRMGEHGATFKPILDGLAKLCKDEIINSKEPMSKLIIEIKHQILNEIKREALTCVNAMENTLSEAVKEGDYLTEKIDRLTASLGAYGRGFALVADETKKSTAIARELEQFMTDLAKETAKKDVLEFKEADKNPSYIKLINLSTAAFKTNVNAFNASVEAARSGGREDCVGCAEGVRNYAGVLQRAYVKCNDTNNDYIKYISILCEKEEHPGNLLKKQVSHIIFNVEFINTQLSLEAKRSSREDFLNLSGEFDRILTAFKNDLMPDGANLKDISKAFTEETAGIIKKGNKIAAEAGEWGKLISYILEEYADIVNLYC